MKEETGRNTTSALKSDQAWCPVLSRTAARAVRSAAKPSRSLHSSSYRAPRASIVLCHGLFGFDYIGPQSIPLLQVHYWRGVKEALTLLGANIVVVARVPRTGDIRERAIALHKFLEESFPNGGEANLIAHSMGGLDCRYMLAHLPRLERVKVHSLTTITTFRTVDRRLWTGAVTFLALECMSVPSIDPVLTRQPLLDPWPRYPNRYPKPNAQDIRVTGHATHCESHRNRHLRPSCCM